MSALQKRPQFTHIRYTSCSQIPAVQDHASLFMFKGPVKGLFVTFREHLPLSGGVPRPKCSTKSVVWDIIALEGLCLPTTATSSVWSILTIFWSNTVSHGPYYLNIYLTQQHIEANTNYHKILSHHRFNINCQF